MFPDAACKAMQSILGDAAHSMEETLEVKGHAALPTLDMVWIAYFDCGKCLMFTVVFIDFGVFKCQLIQGLTDS